jgi:hypothetical protein
LVAQLAAEVVGLRQPSSRYPGLDRFFQEVAWLWAGIFAVSTAGLAVAMAIASADVVELLTTAATMGGIVVGAFLSALWFRPGAAPSRPARPLHPDPASQFLAFAHVRDRVRAPPLCGWPEGDVPD